MSQEPASHAQSVADEAHSRVAVFDVPKNLHDLRDILVRVLGLHPTDAQVQARAVPGLLPEELTPSQAADLLREIQGLGIRAASLPSEDVPELEHASVMHHLRCSDAGLDIVALRGETQCTVPWCDVELISIGWVPLEMSRHFAVDATTVVRGGPRVLPGNLNVASKSGPEAWFIFRNPFRPFRMDHNLMNYEYLGERKSGSATENFRLLIDDVLSHAPDVSLTPATRAYLERGLLHEYEFHASSDLRRYTEIQLLSQRLLA